MGTSCWALLSDLFCVLISRYSITITLINLPSLILAAMTRMRIMMMRQLTRVIFLRLFSVWDTQPPGARLARLSSPEITPSTSGSGARPESEKRHFHCKLQDVRLIRSSHSSESETTKRLSPQLCKDDKSGEPNTAHAVSFDCSASFENKHQVHLEYSR